MPSKIFSRSERFYLQDELTYGQIPNSSGTATLSNSDACAMIKFQMNRTVDTAVRRDKTGARTGVAGVATRRIANWQSDMSLVTGGTAGVAPDCAPIFRSLFGAAPTTKSGTVSITGATNATPIVITAAAHGLSTYDCITITGVGGNTAANGVWIVNVLSSSTFELIGSTGNAAYTSGGSINKAALVWTPTDAELSFTGWSFRSPSTAEQRALGGAIAEQATFNLGEDIATFQAQGSGRWIVQSNSFSSADTYERMGLTSFPTDPGSPITLGNGIAGFKGMAYLNGATVSRIRTAQIKYGSGLVLPRDIFGSEYVDNPEADERVVTASFSMYEDDSTGQKDLEDASVSKTGIDIIFQVGRTAANIYFMVLRGVQLVSPNRDDGQRAFTSSYGDSRAVGTGITAYNEMRLWAI